METACPGNDELVSYAVAQGLGLHQEKSITGHLRTCKRCTNGLFILSLYRARLNDYHRRLTEDCLYTLLTIVAEGSSKHFRDFVVKSERYDVHISTCRFCKAEQGRYTLGVARRLLRCSFDPRSALELAEEAISESGFYHVPPLGCNADDFRPPSPEEPWVDSTTATITTIPTMVAIPVCDYNEMTMDMVCACQANPYMN